MEELLNELIDFLNPGEIWMLHDAISRAELTDWSDEDLRPSESLKQLRRELLNYLSRYHGE